MLHINEQLIPKITYTSEYHRTSREVYKTVRVFNLQSVKRMVSCKHLFKVTIFIKLPFLVGLGVVGGVVGIGGMTSSVVFTTVKYINTTLICQIRMTAQFDI